MTRSVHGYVLEVSPKPFICWLLALCLLVPGFASAGEQQEPRADSSVVAGLNAELRARLQYLRDNPVTATAYARTTIGGRCLPAVCRRGVTLDPYGRGLELTCRLVLHTATGRRIPFNVYAVRGIGRSCQDARRHATATAARQLSPFAGRIIAIEGELLLDAEMATGRAAATRALSDRLVELEDLLERDRQYEAIEALNRAAYLAAESFAESLIQK